MFNFLSDAYNYNERNVATYEKDDLFIDTAAVSDGRKPYETAISHPKYNDNKLVIVEAYDTIGEAYAGHDK